MEERLVRLLARQDIEEVLYRYCRGIDRRDFDLVRACYHADATDDHGSFSGGVEAYVEWVDRLTSRYRWTMHSIGNVMIEFADAQAAPDPESTKPIQVAAVESVGVSLHRSDEPKPYLNLATGFRYLDRFEERNGEWKIAARTAVSEWSMRLPTDGWWEIPESHLTGRRDKQDALYSLLASLNSPRA